MGEIGDGTPIVMSTVYDWSKDRLTPVKVSGLTDVIAVSASQICNSFAVKRDGTVWAWGVNDVGELGNGEMGWSTSRSTPVKVSGLTGVVAVSSGWGHTLSVRNDGTVWSWGWNAYGQLGDGTTTNRPTPVQVAGLADVVAVSAGNMFSLAVKRDGTVWSWGRNDCGQLGNGESFPPLTPILAMIQTTPVAVSGLSGVTAVTAGYWHAVAVKSDGTVWSWGNNYYGELGDGTSGSVMDNANRVAPGPVSVLTDVTAVSAGNSHTVALTRDGTVWYWGGAGDGTTNAVPTPFQVQGLAGAVAVSTGESHMVVLKSDDTAWAWGSNFHGQLGDGTTTFRATPVPALMP